MDEVLWKLGIAFEEHVGKQFEAVGWRVWYRGRDRGGADLGIDLVAEKDTRQVLVQCKYWNQLRNISHLAIELFHRDCKRYVARRMAPGQLSLELVADRQYRFVFVTTAYFTREAKQLADALNIRIREGIPFDHSNDEVNFATAMGAQLEEETDVGQLDSLWTENT